MRLTFDSGGSDVRYETRQLMARMLSSFSGLDRTIGFMIPSRREPRFMTTGGEMTGVHVLRRVEDPGPGFYHIGGSGIVLEEALIRCLGETVERYAQFIADVAGRHRVEVASYDEMERRGEPLLAADKLTFFPAEQYQRPGFPFRPLDRQAPMGWIRAASLIGGEDCWLPAQLLLVGYRGRPGESRLLSSVTTGSAAHTDRGAALRNALRELVQIDAAMGHWFSAAVAPKIELDDRTRPIRSLVGRYFPRHSSPPEFYWLASPDLPGFTVACVIRRRGETPSIGVGLGVDFRLNRALYGALLEAVGVMQMAKKTLIDHVDGGDGEVDPSAIYDLDSNVLHYALPGNSSLLDAKFGLQDTVPARRLPPDRELGIRDEVRAMIDAFRDSGKELFGLDLTTPDVADLGFVVARAWSPDTLSLSLPSAPPALHRRFAAYGGVSNTRPHPYP